MRTNLFVFSILLALAAPILAAPERDRPVGAPAWVDQRVKAWQPRPSELRWQEIGWAKDLATAERLGRERNRPVFLYTHDGHLAVGRC